MYVNGVVGVYLLHFDSGVGNAKHYLGWSVNIGRRLLLHQQGKSRVALTREAAKRGIEMQVVRVWEQESRETERRLKNFKNSARMCPVCNPERWRTNGRVGSQATDPLES